MKVLAIILNYNGLELSTRCAESVLQSVGVDTDVLIVDSASPDGSGRALRNRFGAERVLQLAENRGYAGGMNAGLRCWREQSSAERVLLLTQDILLDPTALGSMVSAMDAAVDVGVVGPVVLLEGTSRVFSAGGELDRRSVSVHHRLDPLSKDAYEAAWLDGCCLLIRQEALEEDSGFDERYFLYLEDVDFCTRVRRRGWKVLIAPGARVWQTKGSSVPAHTLYYDSRNRYRFWRENHQVSAFRVARRLLREVAIGGAYALVSTVLPSRWSEARWRFRNLYRQSRGALLGTIDHLAGRYGRQRF